MLPTLRPAIALYQWLLAHGVPRPDRSNPGISHPSALVAWMPDELHEAIARLLHERQRIPQETLGLRALRTDPSLILRAVDWRSHKA